MTDINEQQIEETVLSSGKRLQLAREQKKITIAEVAAQLRLLQENIQSLEEGQWDNLHGRAYARGYFLSYVRFLALPEEEMLTAFNLEYKSSPHESSMAIVMLDEKKKGLPWLSIIFILLVISAVVGAYFQKQQSDSNSSVDDVQSESSVMEERSFSESVVKPISENTTDVTDVTDVIELTDSVSSSELSQQVPMDVSELTVEAENVAEVNSLDNSEESLNLENIIELKTVESEQQQPVITLQFSDDCWVEIRDNNGDFIINDMMKKGKAVILDGALPFSVLLGKASAVTVMLNDEDFDISAFVNDNVARFNIGEE